MELAARSGTPDPRTDTTLLQLVRAGDDAAFGELFARHAAAVRGYALRCCADVADAEDMAAEAFFRVFQAVRRGAGPDGNPRAYLFTVVRRLAAERSMRCRDVPVSDDELRHQVDDRSEPAPASRVDLQLIAHAFRTLPRRWKAVLWRIEVEGEPPATAAPHFGLSANATAALARRARQGLRAAYLQAHLGSTGGDTGCRAVVAKLGAFTAGQVSGAEADRIRLHLAGCPECADRHAELVDVCAGLRRHAGALVPLAGTGTGHHLLLAKATLGRWVGGVVAGVRLKVAVAAVSVVAVGGTGLAVGPLVARLDPSPTVDRGVAVGPAPLGTRPSTTRNVRPERMAGAFHPARGTTRPGHTSTDRPPTRIRTAARPRPTTAGPRPTTAGPGQGAMTTGSSTATGPQPQWAAVPPTSSGPDPTTGQPSTVTPALTPGLATPARTPAASSDDTSDPSVSGSPERGW